MIPLYDYDTDEIIDIHGAHTGIKDQSRRPRCSQHLIDCFEVCSGPLNGADCGWESPVNCWMTTLKMASHLQGLKLEGKLSQTIMGRIHRARERA